MAILCTRTYRSRRNEFVKYDPLQPASSQIIYLLIRTEVAHAVEACGDPSAGVWITIEPAESTLFPLDRMISTEPSCEPDPTPRLCILTMTFRWRWCTRSYKLTFIPSDALTEKVMLFYSTANLSSWGRLHRTGIWSSLCDGFGHSWASADIRKRWLRAVVSLALHMRTAVTIT